MALSTIDSEGGCCSFPDVSESRRVLGGLLDVNPVRLQTYANVFDIDSGERGVVGGFWVLSLHCFSEAVNSQTNKVSFSS